MRLVTPEQMREMDRRTIDEVGLPGVVLMERAAQGAVDALLDYLDPAVSRRVGLVCGGGNNGGDGFAMARMLAHRGFEPFIALLSEPSSIRGDARTNLDAARALDLECHDLSAVADDELAERLEAVGAGCPVWCDALLGTGLDRAVTGRYAAAIEFMNRQPFVFAVDIPSGVHGESGQEMGVAIEADATATFGEVKLGQALYPGRELCGQLHLVDIGIPGQVVDAVGAEATLLGRGWCAGRVHPRTPNSHKGDSGRVLIVAGSHTKTGACLLATRGALAAGAGLLTVGTHAPVVERVAPVVAEAMAEAMVADAPDAELDDALRDSLATVDAVGIGPGLGTTAGIERAVDLVCESEVPAAVFDADALNVLASRDDRAPLRALARRAIVVLTPHPGEMARLRGCAVDDVTADPVGHARQLADDTGCIVVLKTAATVVAHPDGRLAINGSGNAGMATGGMGDALTGILAARLAEGSEEAFDGVCCGVWAHGAAGDAAAEQLGDRGLSVTALLDAFPAVFGALA